MTHKPHMLRPWWFWWHTTALYSRFIVYVVQAVPVATSFRASRKMWCHHIYMLSFSVRPSQHIWRVRWNSTSNSLQFKGLIKIFLFVFSWVTFRCKAVQEGTENLDPAVKGPLVPLDWVRAISFTPSEQNDDAELEGPEVQPRWGPSVWSLLNIICLCSHWFPLGALTSPTMGKRCLVNVPYINLGHSHKRNSWFPPESDILISQVDHL